MGMKKINTEDELAIVKLLQRWPASKRLSWEVLRTAIIERDGEEVANTWSRQALSANKNVHKAFQAAKRRVATPETMPGKSASGPGSEEINAISSELAELQVRYDALLLRHAQLVYNVSLLEGGTHLLDAPMPDNTRSQGG